MYIGNLAYYILIFICCWYPLIIVCSTFNFLVKRIILSAYYNYERGVYTVYFAGTNSQKKNFFDIGGDIYSFSIDKNGRLRRYYKTDIDNNSKLYIALIYVGLILIIGLVNTEKMGWNWLYFIRAFIYVNIVVCIIATTYIILEKPIEIYAKSCVIKRYNIRM